MAYQDELDMTGEVLHQTASTWYGLPVDVTVAGNNWHRVAVPGLALPHPGMVNIITRWGMPLEERLALTYRHELGHLQTLPIPLAHLVLILWPRSGARSGPRWLRCLAGLFANQVVWELAAEGYLILTTWHEPPPPRTFLSRFLYASFWSVMSLLALAGTAFSLRRA